MCTAVLRNHYHKSRLECRLARTASNENEELSLSHRFRCALRLIQATPMDVDYRGSKQRNFCEMFWSAASYGGRGRGGLAPMITKKRHEKRCLCEFGSQDSGHPLTFGMNRIVSLMIWLRILLNLVNLNLVPSNIMESRSRIQNHILEQWI